MSKSSIAKQAVLPLLAPFLALSITAGMATLASVPQAAFAQSGSSSGAPVLQSTAPDRYVVVKGDTLWGISGKYLQQPWRWPELWRMNREQIHNPNRIYPGDVLVLDRSQSPARLSLVRGGMGGAGAGGTVRLSPQVRIDQDVQQAIPSIPPSAIEPFLTQPLVIEEGGLDKAPRVVGTQDSRFILGSGNVAYVTGVGTAGPSQVWNIYRAGKTLIDPDTKKSLGIEAVFLGTGHVVTGGDPATVQIISSRQEIGVGDRLVEAPAVTIPEYVPHPPKGDVHGRIIGLYNGLPTSETGSGAVVAINRGERDGLEKGNVLAILRVGQMVPDPDSKKSPDKAPQFKLPDERYGLLFVFRVFSGVSYALVMQSTRPVEPEDVVASP